MRFVWLLAFVLAAQAGLAQEVDLRACRPTPEVQRELNRIPLRAPLAQLKGAFFAEQRPRLEALAQKYPRDLFVQRTLVRFLREGLKESRSGSRALPGLYRTAWEKDRKEPLGRYLLGEATAETYAGTSRALLQGMVEEHPDFPWAHFALAELHQDFRQPDNNRAAEHARRFVALCPEAPEGFELLRDLTVSSDQAAMHAVQIRLAVEAMPWEVRLQWMPTLWDLEMQGLDAEQRGEAVRAVEGDVAEILELGRADRAEWFEALEAGARITGDVERSTWAKGELRKRTAVAPKVEFFADSGSWQRTNAPRSDSDWADIQAYYRRALVESAKWVARWPTLEQAWQRRLEAAAGLDELPAEAVIAIGDAALEARMLAVDDYFRPELRYAVARMYLKHGVRVDEVAKLATQPLKDEFEHARTYSANDPAGQSPTAKSRLEKSLPRMFRNHVWASNVLLAELAWRRGVEQDLAAPVSVLEREATEMQAPPTDPMRAERHARERTELNRARARLAVVRGDAAAAVEAYREALRSRPKFADDAPSSVQGDPHFGDSVREEARRYWVKIGRSADEFAPSMDRAGGFTIGRLGTGVIWFQRSRLEGFPPDFAVADLRGKTWTKSDFVGRPGLLAIWPAKHDWYWRNLNTLAAKFGGEFPFLVLATGANPAVFEQIAAREGLDFAIAPVSGPLALKINSGGAPTVWVVDARGELVKHSPGPFSRDPNEVLEEYRQALEQAR